MYLEPEFNEKNAKLLEDLRKDFQIDFEQKSINYCGVFTKNKHAIIHYNPRIVDDESIAHELLHIWLNRYEYNFGNYIFSVCQSHQKLSKIFVKFLCDYIENCLDHLKMYPKYIEMGYKPEKFIKNGLKEKSSINDIKSIHLKFLGKYNSKSVEKYIGCLISIYADHVQNNYTKHLELLKSKESELFRIVTEFWTKWRVFDIENIDPIFNSDVELAESFVSNMENWVENKKIK